MKQEVKIGQTDYTVLVFIPDPASTDGSGKTGLVAADLTVSFVRVETDNDVTITDATSSLNDLANLTAAHADWGLEEVSNTLAPGLYRLDLADAVFASGAWSAVVYVQITTSAAAASPMEFALIPQAPIDGVLLAPTTHTSAVIPTVSVLTGHTAQTGDSYALANGANGFVAIKGDTAAILVDTGTTLDTALGGLITTVGIAGVGLTAVRLSATGIDNILDDAVDGAVTFRQSVRLWNSALAGKLSGAGTTTISIRDLADSKNRIVATVDADGNRSALTLDAT